MRKLTLLGLAMTAIIALSAIASSIASAEEPEFRLSSGTFPVHFTGFIQGKSKLGVPGRSLETIECEKGRVEGEITGEKTSTTHIGWEECAIFRIVEARSLGDPANHILITVTGKLCYINKATKDVGVILTPTAPVHIEAENGRTLAIVTGSAIGLISPINRLVLEFRILLREVNSRQEFLKCEGGTELHLESSKNEGTAEPAFEVAHAVLALLRVTAEIVA
jgi:hypothetical protein